MIRLIDLRGQSTGFAFSFFDTTTNRFIQIGGEQAWRDKADLEEIFDDRIDEPYRNRLLGLVPAWASDEQDICPYCASPMSHEYVCCAGLLHHNKLPYP